MQLVQSNKFNTKTKYLFILVCALFFQVKNTTVLAQNKTYTVVLDAGHGGKDSGNLGNGFFESKIALKVALEVGKRLAKYKGVKVIYTRKKDVFIDLWKRGEIANKNKADLFVSIHCDSHTSQAYGAGTFVLGLRGNKKNLEIAKRENSVVLLEDNYKERYKGFDSNSVESIIGLSLIQEENLDNSLQIASLIQQNFVSSLKRKDRKVKQDNFQVLRETIMPSVLVELGFLTNKREGRYLNSKKGQQQMAKAIAEAIHKYIEQLRANSIVIEDEIDTSDLIEFKVQIASGKRKIATKSYNFKGLKNVERVKVGSYYKYYVGNSSNYKETKTMLTEAKKKGYKSAFLVAFKNGEKVSVSEALKK